MIVKAESCSCGHPTCKTYKVSNGTFYKGSGWNKEDAEFVAWCFNNRKRINDTFMTPDTRKKNERDL